MTILEMHNKSFDNPKTGDLIGYTTLHEMGHTFGAEHSAIWECNNESISANNCTYSSVFNPIDTISQQGTYDHPDSVHKLHFGWLEGGRIFPVWSSGTYTISVYEDQNENVKVLKIPRKYTMNDNLSKVSGYYYLSYRRTVSPWGGYVRPTNYTSGVAIHTDENSISSGGDTVLLDTTPNSVSGSDDIQDGALLAGQTFTDQWSGVSFTVQSVTSTEASITVNFAPRTTRFVEALRSWNSALNFDFPDTVGTVSGGGSYQKGTPVTLQAFPKQGWKFQSWYTSDIPNLNSSSNPLNIPSLDRDVVIRAVFSAAPPPNDDFANATNVNTLPSSFSLYTAGATMELPDEPLPVSICGWGGPSLGNTVWYTYTSPTTRTVSIDGKGDNGMHIVVYTGPTLKNLQPVPGACTPFNAGLLLTKLVFVAQANITYYIQIANAGGNSNYFFAEVPPNDNFASASPLGALPLQLSLRLRGSSREIGEPDSQCQPMNTFYNTVWYSYHPAISGNLMISATYGGSTDYFLKPGLSVFQGTALNNLSAVSGTNCNWDTGSGVLDVTVPVTAGETYWIQVNQFLDNLTEQMTLNFQQN